MSLHFRQIDGRALVVGTCVFLALHVGLYAGIVPLALDGDPIMGYTLVKALEIAVLLGVGFIVGFMARRAPLFHGWTIATAMAVFESLYAALVEAFQETPSVFCYLLGYWIYAGVLASLGSVVGKYVSLRRRPQSTGQVLH